MPVRAVGNLCTHKPRDPRLDRVYLGRHPQRLKHQRLPLRLIGDGSA